MIQKGSSSMSKFEYKDKIGIKTKTKKNKKGTT